MRKHVIKLSKILVTAAACLSMLLLIFHANHQIMLRCEATFIEPIGKRVNVNGDRLNVYTEGDGEKTLVFLSGGGTASPVLDFRSLYTQLSDVCRVVVVEKSGYGFSDSTDAPRDIDTILADTRSALAAANIDGPFVLCPHSMSGIEALYWAQQYPAEVEAIIGLDMATPNVYKDYPINLPMIKTAAFAGNIGIVRLFPGFAENDAIRHGTLTESEQNTMRALFYACPITTPMISEAAAIKANAHTVRIGCLPALPILLFVSNGEGTSMSCDDWRAAQHDFANHENINAMVVALDCPHYVHNNEYTYIAESIRRFLDISSESQTENR